jgi:Na+-transporting NADH:ubiquinone oxidoreductase subunit NqrF
VKEMPSQIANGLKTPVYYAAGPPAMVSAITGVLTDRGIGEDNIRSEDFAGF